MRNEDLTDFFQVWWMDTDLIFNISQVFYHWSFGDGGCPKMCTYSYKLSCFIKEKYVTEKYFIREEKNLFCLYRTKKFTDQSKIHDFMYHDRIFFSYQIFLFSFSTEQNVLIFFLYWQKIIFFLLIWKRSKIFFCNDTWNNDSGFNPVRHTFSLNFTIRM